MPLLYEIPGALQEALTSGGAQLFGAIIKDSSTGQILGHVQQTAALPQFLEQVTGAGAQAMNGFSPLGLISVAQNEHLRQGISALKEGMVLMQGLQYGTLALSGLGLGVSIAGFAVMAAKLRGIETRLEAIASAVGQITSDRREDDIRGILADVAADIRNVDSLTTRLDPQRVAEQLQVSLSRSAARLDAQFRREADVARQTSIPLEQLDRLWTLAAAIRLCQEAAIQALFAADELATADDYASRCVHDQMALLEGLSADSLVRLVSRGEPSLRPIALVHAEHLTDGLKGGVMTLAGQMSIANTVKAEGTRGIDYLRQLRSENKAPLLFLPTRDHSKSLY